MVFEATDRPGNERAWHLAELADRHAFDRFIDTVANAIADRFTLKVHVNVAGRWRAYNCWIAKLQDEGNGGNDLAASCGCAPTSPNASPASAW